MYADYAGGQLITVQSGAGAYEVPYDLLDESTRALYASGEGGLHATCGKIKQ